MSIPTTYSGAEWTGSYGIRDVAARSKFGGGARTVAIVYEPELMRGLPVARDAGSAMNALAGPSRLRYYKVPGQDLPELAKLIAERPVAKGNPRSAPPEAVLTLLDEMW